MVRFRKATTLPKQHPVNSRDYDTDDYDRTEAITDQHDTHSWPTFFDNQPAHSITVNSYNTETTSRPHPSSNRTDVANQPPSHLPLSSSCSSSNVLHESISDGQQDSNSEPKSSAYDANNDDNDGA